MNTEVLNIADWQTRWFERAFSAKDFAVWFQPVINTAAVGGKGASTGAPLLVGHECLIRHRSVTGRYLTGAGILDAARSADRCRAFDELARSLSIQAAAAWRGRAHRGPDGPGPWFINFLPAVVSDPAAFVGNSVEQVGSVGMQPQELVFEAAMSQGALDEIHLPTLSSLRDLLLDAGFGFSLDNAGAGKPASSDTALINSLRPDYVKLDRQVVRSIESHSCAEVVRTLVDSAESVRATVIGCGVESRADIENLWLLGVETMQGFLFGKPAAEPLFNGIGTLDEIAPDQDGADRSTADLIELARAITTRDKPAPEESFHPDIFLIHSRDWQR